METYEVIIDLPPTCNHCSNQKNLHCRHLDKKVSPEELCNKHPKYFYWLELLQDSP